MSETTSPPATTMPTALTNLGLLAHLATLGTSLARLLAEVDYQGDAETVEAIAGIVATLRAATRDQIGDAVIVLTALLDDSASPLLADVPLTVAQVAAILGIKIRSVRQAITAGRLVASQDAPEAAWRIALADLRAYQAQPRQPGGRPRKG